MLNEIGVEIMNVGVRN